MMWTIREHSLWLRGPNSFPFYSFLILWKPTKTCFTRPDSVQEFATYTLRKHLWQNDLFFFPQISRCTFCYVIFAHKIIHRIRQTSIPAFPNISWIFTSINIHFEVKLHLAKQTKWFNRKKFEPYLHHVLLKPRKTMNYSR